MPIDAEPQIQKGPDSRKANSMSTYYVATRIRYVLVEADDENNARNIGDVALHEMHADLGKRLGHEVPFEIRSVRLATTN